MDLESHCARTKKILGKEFKEIHIWLDAFAREPMSGWWGFEIDHYWHRKKRHHKEGIKEAIARFKSQHTEDEIQQACEIHIQDDYEGYLPSKSDFENKDFLKKYHK